MTSNLPSLFEDSDLSGLPRANPGSGKPWRKVQGAGSALVIGDAAGTDRGELVMSRLESGSGDIVVQINGDSTGNEVTDWVYLWCQTMGTAYPSLAIDHRLWNDTTQGYDAAVPIQAGTAPSPGIVFRDTFTRTASDLYLSTPDIGAAWGRDGSNASGDWTLDGNKAVRTADATSGNVLADGNTPGDIKLTVVGTISTLATGSSYTTQFTLKRLSSTNRIVLTITISTTGSVTWAIAKVINGTSTTIANTTSLTALTTNTANQPFTLVYQVVGLNVSATIGASTITATLLQSDADLLDQATVSAVIAHPSTAMTMDTYTMELVTPSQPQKMTVYNCSVPGSNLSYQQPRISSIAPVAPDLMIINTGHNYSTNTPAQYATAIDSFLSDYLSVFPNTGILITSQNPQKAPAANRIFHYTRQTSLRSYCAKRGIGYVPLFEKWINEPDGGVSMINPDGVHPVLTGSQFWANYLRTFLTSTVGGY